MKNFLSLILSTTLLAGCASNPNAIDTSYVSPLKYESFNCQQLSAEMDYVGQRTTTLYHHLKSERNKDNWQMGIGLLLFWPTLFLLEGGDGPEASEYAQLKGEYEALRKNSVQKQCHITKESPEDIIKKQHLEEKE